MPESDYDYKGVFIPSSSEILKPKIIGHKNFSTGDKVTKNTNEDTDREYFAVHKFFDMLKRGDMVATEMLFAPVVNPTPEWNYLVKNRHRLVSKKMAGFVGYAQRQASVYGAKGIRLAEIQDTIKLLQSFPPGRLDAIPDIKNILQNFCNDKQHTSIVYIESKGVDVFHFECCNRKVPLTVTIKTALDIFQRIEQEYGNRARAAQTGQGIEWKSVAHAVRISDIALELLRTGNIRFPCDHREYYKQIRQGIISYDEIETTLDNNLAMIESESETCTILPSEADFDFMDSTVEEWYRKKVIG